MRDSSRCIPVNDNPHKRRKWFQFRLRTLLIAILVLTLPLALIGWLIRNWDDYHEATFRCGNGRFIEIRRKPSWDYASEALYQVVQDGAVVQPKRTFMWIDNTTPLSASSFELIAAENDHLFALRYRNESIGLDELPDLSAGESWTQKLVSSTVVLIHDFETHSSWPAIDSANGLLLQRLIDGHPKWRDYKRNQKMLQSIQFLSLTDVQVGEDELACITTLPNLKYLALENCTITDEGIKMLHESIPKCNISNPTSQLSQ